MRVLSDFTPDLEVYSIDEAFLGLSGFADPDALAWQARATVLQKTGIPVCVGISTTKTLAKVANRTAKKDPASGGVCYLPNDKEQTAALAKMDLGDVWGVGHRIVQRLAEIGITTPLQLRDTDPTMIRQRFNVVLQRTVLELQGTPCLDLEQDSPESKTICCSRSFGRAVEGFSELAEALTAYTSYAAQKMRQQGLATASVVVSDTGRLIRAALWALKGIYRPGFRYKKCGVLFLDLHPADSVQGSLFLRPDRPERVRLMDCVDQLNARYGRDRVRFACSGQDRPWKLRAEYLSQRYTTRWGELLAV